MADTTDLEINGQPVTSALTWDELADLYDERARGRRAARTQPMSKIAEWAMRQDDLLTHPEDNTYHKIRNDS